MASPSKVLPPTAIAAALFLAAAGSRAQATHAHPGHAPTTASAPTPLSGSSRAAVEEALQDELRGEAMYARVLKDHGDVRPFSNVIRAERRHADFLEGLLKARGLTVPAHPAGAEAPAFASVREACAAAVEFETANVALYDRLLAAGTVPNDVKETFEHNRMASLDHHKPAFERCSGVATARGAGRGAGRGGGRGAGHAAARGAGSGHGCRHAGPGQGQGGHGCRHAGPGQGQGGHGCGHAGPGQGQGGHGCGHCGHGHGES